MKRITLLFLAFICALNLAGCGKHSSDPVKIVEGNVKKYYETSDGTWEFEGQTYKYRLEICGRLPSAAKDTTYVYLSNIKDISFQKAMMASGLSSNTEDYFSPKDAILVEIH